MNVCLSCQEQLNDDPFICPDCGEPTTELEFEDCPTCKGGTISPTSDGCHECGNMGSIPKFHDVQKLNDDLKNYRKDVRKETKS